ncbi:MAG: hypothetical protein P8X57_13755 [Cyclobacteriaceae bacterium]
MRLKKFSDKDRDRIREAVREAEKRTSGEIVTYFVAQSDEYEEVRLRSVLMFVAAPLFLLAILSYAWLLPIQVTPFLVTIISTLMGVIGQAIAIKSVKAAKCCGKACHGGFSDRRNFCHRKQNRYPHFHITF